MKLLPQFLQVYGMLDVQRVAGNFHISVHGLNIFVAEKVSNLKLQIPYDFSTLCTFWFWTMRTFFNYKVHKIKV